MAIPRVFLSSTCYDLAEVRDSLNSFIESYGFEPCLSDKGDIFYHPDIHTHNACVSEISNCQLFVLIIGGRFGGSYIADTTKSIVNAEYSAAKELNIPVFTFIKRNVLDDHRVYQKNKSKEIVKKIDFPSIENQAHAEGIFGFIDEVRLAKVNNGNFGFEYSRDIQSLLRKQWAGMFYDFLQRRVLSEQYESQNNILSSLTSTTGQLDELVKKIYRRLDNVNADSVIADVEVKSKAEQFFRDILRYYGLSKFETLSINEITCIPTDQFWFTFLKQTKDFEIWKDVSDSANNRQIDVLLRPKGGRGIVLQAKIGELSNLERNILSNYENCYSAFKSLGKKEQHEILIQFMQSKEKQKDGKIN